MDKFAKLIPKIVPRGEGSYYWDRDKIGKEVAKTSFLGKRNILANNLPNIILEDTSSFT